MGVMVYCCFVETFELSCAPSSIEDMKVKTVSI